METISRPAQADHEAACPLCGRGFPAGPVDCGCPWVCGECLAAMTRRAPDKVALGAYKRAGRPAPHDVEKLGRRLLEAHGGFEAALGWLVWRLQHLEDR